MKIQITPEQRPIFQALLPIPLSNNNTGRGGAFWQTAKDRKAFQSIIEKMGLKRDPFSVPVVVHLTRILGKGQRLYDEDSILRGAAKELLDSLVACGWFEDDSAAHIAHCAGFQDATQREHGPQTLVEIYDAADAVTIPSSLYDWMRDDTLEIGENAQAHSSTERK